MPELKLTPLEQKVLAAQRLCSSAYLVRGDQKWFCHEVLPLHDGGIYKWLGPVDATEAETILWAALEQLVSC